MTVIARWADPADRSSDSSQPTRNHGRPAHAVAGIGWVALCAWVFTGAFSLGQDSMVVEDATLPAPGMVGSFDGVEGDYKSVLVDDGESAILSSPSLSDALSDSGGERGLQDCGNPCQIGWDDGCRGNGCSSRRWAITADALVLWRNNIAGQPLLLDSIGALALDPADVRTAAAAGPRFGVIRSLGCGRAIEGNYFNVGGIQGTTATDGLGVPYTAIGLADIAFADIDGATYTTRGQIKSAELNYRWCQGRRVIWLAGFRWVEWNELAAVDMQPSGDNIQTNVGNDLYGGQFGCRLRFWDLGKWQVGGVGKVGAFGTAAYQRTTAIVDQMPLGPISASDTDVAFFGEVGVNSTLWITHWLAWRAGYNFFWLEGVATAAQQLPLGSFGTGTAAINTNGSVFLQGFSTGLEARW